MEIHSSLPTFKKSLAIPVFSYASLAPHALAVKELFRVGRLPVIPQEGCFYLSRVNLYPYEHCRGAVGRGILPDQSEFSEPGISGLSLAKLI